MLGSRAIRKPADMPGIASAEAGGWQVEVHAQDDQVIDDLEAFTIRVRWNGWTAGIITLAGGMTAAGELSNEDTFISALQSGLVVSKVKPESGPCIGE